MVAKKLEKPASMEMSERTGITVKTETISSDIFAAYSVCAGTIIPKRRK